MFGYLRPVQGELKVYELERFKACYCGLCRTLGNKYGQAARFVLSYELVFLSMLLWEQDVPLEVKRGRCIAGPFRRRKYCVRNPALDACAGYNVILAWWKLRDSIADKSFLKSIPHRMAALLLRRAYKRASREYIGFETAVEQSLTELEDYEKGANTASLDGAADKFAKILMSVSEGLPAEPVRRPMSEMLYHLGRWIYILDACDDYKSDISSSQFNAVAVKFPPENENLSEAGKDRIGTTLAHSNNLVCLAFELLPENLWSQTVRNTIYLGMPDVTARVLSGKWPPKEPR